MTDSTTAPEAPTLTPFEGKAVKRVGIEMPSAAGGLREALKFEPVELHMGEEGYMLVHWSVGKVRFDPTDKSDVEASDLQRVHVLDVKGVTLVADEEWAKRQIAEQNRRIQVAREKAKGVEPLAADGVDGSDWGGEAGPLDEPVDPQGAKVIAGAFGGVEATDAALADADGEGDALPPGGDAEWEDQPPPPEADTVKSRRRD